MAQKGGLSSWDMWSSIAKDNYLIVILHWLDENQVMQTIVWGTMAFNGHHVKRSISKAMFNLLSKLGMFACAELIE